MWKATSIFDYKFSFSVSITAFVIIKKVRRNVMLVYTLCCVVDNRYTFCTVLLLYGAGAFRATLSMGHQKPCISYSGKKWKADTNLNLV